MENVPWRTGRRNDNDGLILAAMTSTFTYSASGRFGRLVRLGPARNKKAQTMVCFVFGVGEREAN